MGDDMRIISTEEELKVFNDPYRMKIIRTYQKADQPLTVKMCADIMDEVPAKVHYHVKKLLKINLLVPHHTEDINGITAKYYHLPNKSFTISLKDTNEETMYHQLTQVHQMVSNLMEDFKEEFMKATSHGVKDRTVNDADVGMLTSVEVELSEKEFEEVSSYLVDITKKYNKTDEEKRTYVFLAGLGRKIE